MAMVEVFLAPLVTFLLDKLASGELLKFLRRVGIDAHLKEWRMTLLIIKSVLSDAENKQTANEAVKEWLNELEILAYDLDDLVDDLNTEALQRRLAGTEGRTSKVRKLLPTCCADLSFSDFMFDNRIASKLKDTNDRLEILVKKISMLSLVENVRGLPERTGKRLQMTSLVDESDVQGREEDKEKIIEMLLGAESSGSPISVIPVVGMGGVGKTTLVQLVYNDGRVNDKFDLKAWACVSDEFDAFRVTKIILEAVLGVRCDYEDFNMLQVKLKENLLNKRFLIVLDDVWNENYGDWDILRRPFLSGKLGSKIIVTSRHQRVAKIMSPISAHHVTVLSDDNALSLLAHHALGTKNFDGRQDVKEIGESLVKRCKNLPLAVKAVGGILRTRANPKDWEDVFNNDIWINGENSEILPSLKLSYQYLPPQLKRCFAYCAIFPKDYEFDKSELLYLWMAEGFLHHSQQERSTEELGIDYFDELLARSFFQQSSFNSSCFVMHDLLNDLAISVAGDKCLMLDDKMKENLQSNISVKVRHLSFIRHFFESYQKFNLVSKFQSLRTFLPLPINKYVGQNFMSQRVLLDLLPKLYCLRVLSLSGYDSIYELPSSISNLRHLRYLNLTRTSLKQLPESLTTLVNLQVLILRNCDRLIKLPPGIENLINLHHLDIVNTDLLDEVPEGIAQLASLQTLSKLIVSKSNGLKLEDLGKLSLLQGEIYMMELQNVVNVQEAIDARLMHKPSLNKIRLAWSNNFDDSRNEMQEAEVLNALKPHENLSSLEVDYYGGTKLSSWIGDLSFSKLAKIRISSCKNCMSLPTLGHLPLLRELSIQGMNRVKVVGVEFYGNLCSEKLSFQSLETLHFEDMPEWEEWHGLLPELEAAVEFPKLCELIIRSCPKLVKLPILSLPSTFRVKVEECSEVVLNCMHNLTSLTHLKLENIFGLTSVLKAFDEFPLKLENLEIDHCEDLVTLWPNDNISRRLDNLRKLIVKRCPQLLSLKEIGALPVVTSLSIDSCAALEFLPKRISPLTILAIQNCPLLKTVELEECGTSLESLIINLGNLNMTNLLGSSHNYSRLTFLNIYSCDDLEAFPHGGLPTPNLRHLHVTDCRHLKTLPDQMELLSSLKSLWVENCTSLVDPFPRGNIPPNLTSLAITNCGKLKPLAEWDLHKLTSLYEFVVSGGYPELVSFSINDDEHNFFPPSLTQLWLSDLPKLEILSKGFQNLTSLRRLSISKCPNLLALPMDNNLHNLWSLWIDDCPLIKKRCLKYKGDYWTKIIYIPEVLIDGHPIY
ncbi:disease resistance RPP13 1 [Olea europaea subsp. europaea]|uniref:Disease resistance RPP13 1 n=1 Tax=Olea europaea subsp. europaea TaxID=158383 RepID=A0A8S0US64_OLEEU|nr:disease resistance RPP13 1 [Olea europaea subsp. europaea]